MKIHVRRGIGTVIGTAFFLLILLSGFSLFMYQLTSMKNYANVVSGVQELDQERSSEDIEVLGVTTIALDKLNLTVRNAGSYQTHLIFLGIRDDATSSYEYYGIDFYVDPAETLTDVRNESIISEIAGRPEAGAADHEIRSNARSYSECRARVHLVPPIS